MRKSWLVCLVGFLLFLCPRLPAQEVVSGVVTAGTLNVRDAAGTDGRIEFVVHEGNRVRILERSGSWCRIEIRLDGKDRQGWAHAEYIRSIQAVPQASPQTREERVAFVLDPERSTLDLLGEDGAALREFSWHRNDYPGSPDGPNEERARSVSRSLRTLLPERRVNTGEHELPFDWERIEPALVAVEGQDRFRLHRLAAESFGQMSAAASADGVSLRLVSAARTPEQQKKLAAKNKNPEAVAQGVSAHNYGLAIDLAMSPGAAREFLEVTTRPFSNVIGMRESPVHKWMFLFGPEHGWYPYHNEPWHWEYNPEGLAERFP